MPGVSEPLTGLRACLRDGGEGEGPLPRHLGELCWRSIVQGTVRALLVVICAPALQLLTCIGQVEEDFSVQTFIAQRPLKLSI